MNTERGMSRRNVLRVGAVIASSAAVVSIASTSGATDSDYADQAGPGTGKRAELGLVSSSDRTSSPQAQAQAQAQAQGILAVEAPSEANGVHSRVASAQTVPYAGFPAGFVPRAGDLVTVTDQYPGLALAAVPVCRWVTGVPKRRRDGSFTVAGHRVAASPKLTEHGSGRVKVCLLDTELPSAQVLSVRV